MVRSGYPDSRYYKIQVPKSSLNIFEKIFHVTYIPGDGFRKVVIKEEIEKRKYETKKWLDNFPETAKTKKISMIP